MSNQQTIDSNYLNAFMQHFGLNKNSFAEIMGVTPQAVVYWMRGQRPIPLSASKVILLFARKPELMKEF